MKPKKRLLPTITHIAYNFNIQFTVCNIVSTDYITFETDKKPSINR